MSKPNRGRKARQGKVKGIGGGGGGREEEEEVGGEPSQLVNRSDLSGRPQGGATQGAAWDLGTLIPM